MLDEKECCNNNNCKGRTSVYLCADACTIGAEQDTKCVEEYCYGLKVDKNNLEDQQILAGYDRSVSFNNAPTVQSVIRW